MRPLPGETLRLLHVHAHPDDEASKGAAATAKYVAEGVDVMVATCTGGERGDVLNEAVDLAGRDISEVRRAEMAESAQILGVQHVWLGFEDSGFPEGDPPPPLPAGCFADLPLAEVTAPLTELVKQFKPHVVTTYDENGGYPHPDHIRCHEVTMAAVRAAADEWQVSKVYYHMTFNRERVLALHRAALEHGHESPFARWIDTMDQWPDEGPRVTTQIECGEFFDVRDRALKAHATQIDPEGLWFAVPTALQREVWPYEDFELAVSVVATERPEDDLFAGLR